MTNEELSKVDLSYSESNKNALLLLHELIDTPEDIMDGVRHQHPDVVDNLLSLLSKKEF